MFAMPTAIFFAPLALMIFLALGSSPSNSAAVGAEGAATGSVGLAGSAPSALGAPLAAAPLAGASPACLAAFGSLDSFAGFFGFSSAIKFDQWMPVLAFGLRC